MLKKLFDVSTFLKILHKISHKLLLYLYNNIKNTVTIFFYILRFIFYEICQMQKIVNYFVVRIS